MELLKTPHYLTKSFWCIGKDAEVCYPCQYCRWSNSPVKNLNISTVPTDISPLFKNVPVVINLFYGDPLLQISKTIEYIKKLEWAEHTGAVVIITKGEFIKFPRLNTGLDLHFAFSTFGKDHPLDGGSMSTFINNMKEAEKRGKHKYSIEFRPIIYQINDDYKTIDNVMYLAKEFGLSVGYSGLLGSPECVSLWSKNNTGIQPFPDTVLGYKKHVSKDVVNLINEYKDVSTFKKTSCLISHVHNMDRDYNAHYYRPNELGCNNCVMKAKCETYYNSLPNTQIPQIPFKYEVVHKDNHECGLYSSGVCKFPSSDCKNLKGYFIKIEDNITTSDVRLIKWLTGMTVIAPFVEQPYINEKWVTNKE